MDRRLIPEIAPPLQALGDLLFRKNVHFGLVIVGGAALNLLGLIHRPTEDVDVLALRMSGSDGEPQILPPPEPLPEVLINAIQQVSEDFQLSTDWLNVNVAGHWWTGLPPGWAKRVHWQELPGLSLGLVDRYDLIFLKLYAAADHAQLELTSYQPSKHDLDLIALSPTDAELAAARTWVAAQDSSPLYPQCVDNVIAYIRAART